MRFTNVPGCWFGSEEGSSTLVASSEPDGYDGVSTLTTASKARAYARAFNLGEWIATLDVPADAAVFVGPTSANGHVDVRGDPADLLAMVAAVEPVEPPT